VPAHGLIRQSVLGQAKIIDDLLDLSLMRTGKLTRTAAALPAMVAEQAEIARADAFAAELEIVTELPRSRSRSMPARCGWSRLSATCSATRSSSPRPAATSG
jgi:signal transduction histidine kinase